MSFLRDIKNVIKVSAYSFITSGGSFRVVSRKVFFSFLQCHLKRKPFFSFFIICYRGKGAWGGQTSFLSSSSSSNIWECSGLKDSPLFLSRAFFCPICRRCFSAEETNLHCLSTTGERGVSKILMGFFFSSVGASVFCFRFSQTTEALPKDIWQRRFKELNLNFFFVVVDDFAGPLPLSTRLLMEIKYHSVILHKM